MKKKILSIHFRGNGDRDMSKFRANKFIHSEDREPWVITYTYGKSDVNPATMSLSISSEAGTF